LAEPLFQKLQRDGMKPGFEAQAALEFNPYPHPMYRISFDDVFWHLDKEIRSTPCTKQLPDYAWAIARPF
jgi:hypothetical protein